MQTLKRIKKTGETMMNKSRKVSFLAALTLLCASSMLSAWGECDVCENDRFYVGGFGGALYSESTHVSQLGTAYFTEAEGGPLAVIARGHTKSKSTGFGGAQLGYEWREFARNNQCGGFSLLPAVEFEAFFFNNNRKGHLINPTTRLPEHDFAVTLNSKSSVLLVNAVFALENSCLYGFTPYVGGGLGAARSSINRAKSYQLAPAEADINHFNSGRSDSNWTFAAQFKAGLSYKICDRIHLFGEYRYIYLDTNHYVLGSTDYVTHVPTSPWNVKVKHTNFNAFAFGIQFDL
jgi:opacity protein-like surface antigen